MIAGTVGSTRNPSTPLFDQLHVSPAVEAAHDGFATRHRLETGQPEIFVKAGQTTQRAEAYSPTSSSATPVQETDARPDTALTGRGLGGAQPVERIVNGDVPPQPVVVDVATRSCGR